MNTYIKHCFVAQRNLRSPAAVAGGGTGLDFTSFLKFLVMISYHALSKTNNYSSLYNTIEVLYCALNMYCNVMYCVCKCSFIMLRQHLLCAYFLMYEASIFADLMEPH